jgi:hypothetical protein
MPVGSKIIMATETTEDTEIFSIKNHFTEASNQVNTAETMPEAF